MSGNAFLIDSSIWIVAYRRSPPAVVVSRLRELITADEAAINEVIRLEVLVGVRGESERRETKNGLAGLRALPLDPATWEVAATLGSDLRGAGLVVSIPDLLIAANAIVHDVVLVHRDSDFEMIAAKSTLRTEFLS